MDQIQLRQDLLSLFQSERCASIADHSHAAWENNWARLHGFGVRYEHNMAYSQTMQACRDIWYFPATTGDTKLLFAIYVHLEAKIDDFIRSLCEHMCRSLQSSRYATLIQIFFPSFEITSERLYPNLSICCELTNYER